MPTSEEKAAFADRLHLALRRVQLPPNKNGERKTINGPTALAMQLTLRHNGAPINPQAADKWLKGRAIPKKDKLATIAAWCKVDPHWLEYGSSPITSALQTKQNIGTFHGKPSAETLELALQIQRLLPHQRYIIEELISQLQAPNS